jgi:hypothetical protein
MSSIFGKPVQKLDSFAVDAPTAKTYHGLTIKVNNNVIGRIKSWQPTAYSREGNHVYELNVDSFGRPVDYVPGIATGFTVAFSRVELWREEIEVALGLTTVEDIFDDLTDQTRPFTIDEFLYRGTSLYRHWVYRGCWFQDRNEDGADAQGDGIYTVNATIAYIQRTLNPI